MMLANMARWAAIFGGFRSRNDRGGSNAIGFLVAIIIAPLAAMLVQLAISRSREYAADKADSPYVYNKSLKRRFFRDAFFHASAS